MKKFTLLAASALILAGSAQAALEKSPFFYQEDFNEMAKDNDRVTDGWLSKGVDSEPANDANIRMYFGTLDVSDPSNPVYGAPYYNNTLLQNDGSSYAFLNTCYPSGVDVNEWLISPEFDMPYDDAMLTFDLVNYAIPDWVAQTTATGYTAPFKIMVSAGGTDAADFTEIYSNSPSVKFATDNTPIGSTTYVIPISGFGGKKIRIALNVTTPNIGMVGFTNIQVGQYAMSYANSTQTVAQNGDEIAVRVNIGLKTPVTCPGVYAKLEYDGKVVEKTYKKKFGDQTGKYAFQLMTFNDPMIKIADDKSVDYTLTVIPQMQDENGETMAEADILPTVISGSIVCATKFFPNNVVMEEATATGCGWCPRGIGAAQYYTDLMAERRQELGVTDENDGPKFIPIMIHSNMNYSDPMNQGVQLYVSSFTADNGGGLPMASFSRSLFKQDPSALKAFQNVFNTDAIYQSKIKFAYNNSNSASTDVTIGDEVCVVYSIETGFTVDMTNLAAAVVFLENDVQGYESGYTQENYLSRYNSSSSIGASGIPDQYYKRFFAGGELGVADIPFNKMVYQEVARGIWPDYYGQDLNSGFTSEVPKEFKISFTVPENLVNLDIKDNLTNDKFDVVVLIIDNSTHEIVASDKMNFAKALQLGESVTGIAADEAIRIERAGRNISVAAPAAVKVALYAADGKALGNYADANGNLLINADDFNGVVIVKAETADKNVSTKLVF